MSLRAILGSAASLALLCCVSATNRVVLRGSSRTTNASREWGPKGSNRTTSTSRECCPKGSNRSTSTSREWGPKGSNRTTNTSGEAGPKGATVQGGDGSCGCSNAPWATTVCACAQFCYCPLGNCWATDQGTNGCSNFVQRQVWFNTDGSLNTACDTNWIREPDGSIIRYNWLWFWIPDWDMDWDTANQYQLQAFGSTDGGTDSQFGAYCTGWPIGGYFWSATNGANWQDGWPLGDDFYVRSVRAEWVNGGFNDGEPDNDMMGLKLVMWPLQDLQPYNEITCQMGSADGSDFVAVNDDLDDWFPSNYCGWCDQGGSCSNLRPKCMSPIDRIYGIDLNDMWAGPGEDFQDGGSGYDFADDARIFADYPLQSVLIDRYTGTWNFNLFNPGNPGRNPNPGTCVMTRFYPIACDEIWNDLDHHWPSPSGGASADGAADVVIGCGTSWAGVLGCGDSAGQGWASYANMDTFWTQCVWTRVVDESDWDCQARINSAR